MPSRNFKRNTVASLGVTFLFRKCFSSSLTSNASASFISRWSFLVRRNNDNLGFSTNDLEKVPQIDTPQGLHVLFREPSPTCRLAEQLHELLIRMIHLHSFLRGSNSLYTPSLGLYFRGENSASPLRTTRPASVPSRKRPSIS